MTGKNMPRAFAFLLSEMSVEKQDIKETSDGFFMVARSVSDILSTKEIFQVPDTDGQKLCCDLFFDDWFLYAVEDGKDYAYSLFKLREQEHDAQRYSAADADTPGVTVSFVSFDIQLLINCLNDPGDENRKKLNIEINRVVAYRAQRHHKALKKYFKDPRSEGAYLVADTYVRTIARYAVDGCLRVPTLYKEIVRQSLSGKRSTSSARLPKFIESLNEKAGGTVCDHEKIYIKNKDEPSEYECLAILATHTANTSFYSFAAEVEYHARFLTPLAKIKIPFLGRSVYDSAIRADMTVGDTEFQGPSPFYKSDSQIVKRQYKLHQIQNKTIR